MKTVLVAVLDWGLGHATRSIPVIRELMKQHARVLIAGDGSSLELLKQEFPSLKFYELPAYNIRYPETGSLIWAMVKQIPRIRQVIKNEHKIISGIVGIEKVNAIISDNRYGCYSTTIPSVIICHQLNLQLTQTWQSMRLVVNTWHKKYLKRFNEIWLPDMPEDSLSFSGALSKTELDRIKPVGILSRFFDGPTSKDGLYDLVALVSGPEPQRTIFENMLRKQLLKFRGKALLITGLPIGQRSTSSSLVEVNHLKASELDAVLRNTKVVVSRSGYSTIMDLAVLARKAILVPTPGQPEQEYLAEHLSNRGWIVARSQHNFDLMEALEAVEKINPIPHVRPNAFLPQTVTDLLSIC